MPKICWQMGAMMYSLVEGDDEQFVACAAVSVYEVFGGLAGVGGDVLRLEFLVQCVALGGGKVSDGGDLEADEIGNVEAA